MFGAGIIGLISTPRQEDPQISVPLIDVFVEYNCPSSSDFDHKVRLTIDTSSISFGDHVCPFSM
jgi:multidrug efflux pump subunit AcrB